MLYSTDMCNSQVWWVDDRFNAPMATLGNATQLYVQDFILFKHPDLGKTVAKILKFYTRVILMHRMMYIYLNI